jgi:hypothetical protein
MQPVLRVHRLLWAGTLAVGVMGVLTVGISPVINAAVAVAIAVAVQRRIGTRHPRYALAVSSTAALHVVGMLGAYDQLWWYDHLTHTLAGLLVTVAMVWTLRAVDPTRPRVVIVGGALLGTAAIGVLWEVIEIAARWAAQTLALPAVLVHYGTADTVYDLIFNMVGAALAVLTRAERWL